MDDLLAKYGGATDQAPAPAVADDPLAKYGGAIQAPEELAQDIDPFVKAEQLHASLLFKHQGDQAAADTEFGAHPLFNTYVAAQNARVAQKAKDPLYHPLQEYYAGAQPADLDLKGIPDNQIDQAVTDYSATKAAQKEQAFRVTKSRLQTYGTLDAPGESHGITQGAKELYGVLPTARGVGYDVQATGTNLVSRLGESSDRNQAIGELAQRELQASTQRGLTGVGRAESELGDWWARQSWLPGGTIPKDLNDAQIHELLRQKVGQEIVGPEKLKPENFQNWFGGADQPTHQELLEAAHTKGPTANLDWLRFGAPKSPEAYNLEKEIRRISALPEDQKTPDTMARFNEMVDRRKALDVPETDAEKRQADMGTAAEMAAYAAMMKAPPLSVLGRVGGSAAALAARTPLWLARKFGVGLGGVAARVWKAGQAINNMVRAAAPEAAPAAEAATAAGPGVLRNFVKDTLPAEIWAGRALKDRGTLGGALAEGVKGAFTSAAAALPFAAGAHNFDEAADTVIGLGLMGALHAGGHEAITGKGRQAGAVNELANLGASLKTGTAMDAVHQAAIAKLPADQARQINAVRGLVSRFKDANGNPYELHAVDADNYAKILARYNPSMSPAEVADAAKSRGYYSAPDGKAFVNVDAEGAPGASAYHEGGHAVRDALSALNDSVKDSAKSAIAETLYTKDGKLVPQFARFVQGYNKTAPSSGQIDLAKPEGRVRAEDEFIAEYFRNKGQQGDVGSLLVDKTLGRKITDRFNRWAKDAGVKSPDKLGEFNWQEVPAFTARMDDLLGKTLRGAHRAPAPEPSAANRITQNTERMGEIQKLPPAQRTPAILAEYDRLKKETDTLNAQAAQIPQPGAVNPPAPALGTPPSPVPAPAGVSDAQTRENVRKALIQLRVPAREAAALAKAAQGANDSEMLADALKRRTPGRVSPPAPALATPAPAAPAAKGAALAAVLAPELPKGNPHANDDAPDYIPTVEVMRAAQKVVKPEVFEKLTEGREGGEPHQDPTIRAYTAEQVAREVVDAAQRGADPVAEIEAKSAKIYDRAKEVQARRDKLGPKGKPEPIVSYDYGNSTPEAAARDAAIEQQVATLAKTKDDHLHQLVNLTTARAGMDKGLMQRRVDKNGKVSISGRIDPSIPEHRALLKELDLAPEVEQQLMAAQTATEAKYVDYYSAPKEKGAEGDISGKQRRAEYEADKAKRSRSEKDIQRNKAILFTSASLTKDGFVMQKGLSIDKFLANAHKLLEAAKEHNLGVDYHGINDPQIQEDLDGYVQNHKNGYKGDGSAPVAGATPTEGYEPYQIPRNRFDLLNAAFHNEASTGVKRYEGKLAAHEAAKAKGEKSRKPALRAETAENAAEAQNLARENQWQVDDETGDTNPFRALLNKEGKLVTTGKGGALRKGTQENLEGVWESLNPAHIDAIRDQPVGNRDIVRDVGYTGEPKGVFSKGLPNMRNISGGFMPESGALSHSNVANDPNDISRTLGIKYDGPIAGTDAHQFTAPKIGTQGGATFTVRGALTPDKVAGKLAEKQAAFGALMPTNVTIVEVPGGRRYLVDGHNRIAAANATGQKTVVADVISLPNGFMPKSAQSYHTIAEKRGALSSGISLPSNDQKPTVNPSEYPKGYRQQNAIDPRATSSEDATRSLAAFQERQSAQGGRVPEPGKARSVSEFRASLAPLLKASQDAGRVWSSKPRTGADTGGQEHDVITSGADGRVLKFTHPDTAGKILTTRDGKSLSLTNADPSDYLYRIRLQNEVFGDDTKIEGVEKNKEGQLSIVTSQRAIHGTEPNESDVAQTMRDAGFTQVGPSEYYRAADNILVGDAHTGNFVKTPDGTVPIDVTIQTPDGKLLEWAEREAQNKRLPQKRGALQGAAQ